MKTDKLLQLIQQKKVMRSGGALPLPKAQVGLPSDYAQFLEYSKTAPENRRPDANWKYGDPRNYDHYGMWDALGKPKNWEEALKNNPEWQRDEYDQSYHGFSTNPNTGVWLKSHIPGEYEPGNTSWMENLAFQLSGDPNYNPHNFSLVFDPELQRMRYIPKERQGGSLPKAQQGILDYYVNKSKEQKKTQSTGGCPPGFIKDPITKNCKPDTSRIPDINQKSDENLDQYLYLTNQLDPVERTRFEIIRSLKKIRGNDPTAPKTSLIENIRQTGGQGEYLPVDPYSGLPVINLKEVEVVGQKDYGSYIDQLRKDWASSYNEHPIMNVIPGGNALLTLGNLLSTPQKSLMYGFTGRYDTPSNINPTRGLGNFQNSAVDFMQDIAFDPLSFSGAFPELFSRVKNIFKGGNRVIKGLETPGVTATRVDPWDFQNMTLHDKRKSNILKKYYDREDYVHQITRALKNGDTEAALSMSFHKPHEQFWNTFMKQRGIFADQLNSTWKFIPDQPSIYHGMPDVATGMLLDQYKLDKLAGIKGKGPFIIDGVRDKSVDDLILKLNKTIGEGNWDIVNKHIGPLQPYRFSILDAMSLPKNKKGGPAKYQDRGGVYFDTTNEANSFYEPLTKTIHLSDADKHIPGVVPHEMFHYWQDINGDSAYPDFYPGPLKEPTIPSGNDAAKQYWNRRALDQNYITDEFLSRNPSFNFAPSNVVYNRYVNPTMYNIPWTLEGEARNFEKPFQGPSPYPQDYGYKRGGSLRRAQSGNKGQCPEGQVWNEEFQTCMMKGVEINYYDQLIEEGRNFMRDWTNSPMAQQMLQRSVQKDNPTGWEKFFSNYRPLSFDSDTYSFDFADPFWQQIRDKRLENINDVDVKFSRKEIDERYPKDKGVAGFSRTVLSEYPSSYWNFIKNINPKLKQKYWKQDLQDWYDTSGNYLDSYGTSDNMEVSGYEGSNAYNALGYYPTDESKIVNSPIFRITNTPFSKYNLLDTNVHEISHASDFGGPLIPISDINLMGKYAYNTARKRQKPNIFGHYPKMVGMDKFDHYVATPTETRARLNALRFQMKNQGIYNPFTDRAFKGMFDNYKSLERLDGWEFDPLEQLRDVYTDDQIIDMLNTISRNESNEESNQAQKGGSLHKAQLGNYIPSWLNPNNWGVKDYSVFGSFDEAFAGARGNSEKEFMWNGNRYTTDLAKQNTTTTTKDNTIPFDTALSDYTEWVKGQEARNNWDDKLKKFIIHKDPSLNEKSPEGGYTIGYGHKIQKGEDMSRYYKGFTEEEALQLLRDDIMSHYKDSVRLFNNAYSGRGITFDKLNPNQQLLLTDYNYQGAWGWKKFRDALVDYNLAKTNLEKERARKIIAKEYGRTYTDRETKKKRFTRERNKQTIAKFLTPEFQIPIEMFSPDSYESGGQKLNRYQDVNSQPGRTERTYIEVPNYTINPDSAYTERYISGAPGQESNVIFGNSSIPQIWGANVTTPVDQNWNEKNTLGINTSGTIPQNALTTTEGFVINPKKQVYSSESKERKTKDSEWNRKQRGAFGEKSQEFLKGLGYYAPKIQQDFGLTDAETKELMKITFGIYGSESNFQSGLSYKLKSALRKPIDLYKNIAPDWLNGDESSIGPGQIKLNAAFDNPEKKALLEKYGITKDNLWDSEIASAAILLLTAHDYKTLNKLTGVNFENTDSVTLKNVLYGAHNKGIENALKADFSESTPRTKKQKAIHLLHGDKDWNRDYEESPTLSGSAILRGLQDYSNLHLTGNYQPKAQSFGESLDIDYDTIKRNAQNAVGNTSITIPASLEDYYMSGMDAFGIPGSGLGVNAMMFYENPNLQYNEVKQQGGDSKIHQTPMTYPNPLKLAQIKPVYHKNIVIDNYSPVVNYIVQGDKVYMSKKNQDNWVDISDNSIARKNLYNFLNDKYQMKGYSEDEKNIFNLIKNNQYDYKQRFAQKPVDQAPVVVDNKIPASQLQWSSGSTSAPTANLTKSVTKNMFNPVAGPVVKVKKSIYDAVGEELLGGYNTVKDLVDVGTNKVQRSLVVDYGLKKSDDIEMPTPKVKESDRPLGTIDYYNKYKTDNNLTYVDMPGTDGQQLGSGSIDLSTVKFKARNLGDYTPFTSDGLFITTAHPFLKPDDPYYSKSLTDNNSVIGVDTNGNFVAGTYKELKNRKDIVISRAPLNKVVSFDEDANGFSITKPDDNHKNGKYEVPIITVLDEKDNKKTKKGALNVLVSPKNENFYGSVQGGKFVIQNPDTKKTKVVIGSLKVLKEEYKKMKGNSAYANIYVLDNGTYAKGLAYKDKQFTAERLKAYDKLNARFAAGSGGSGLYITGYGIKPDKYKEEYYQSPSVRTEKDESFKKGHALKNEMKKIVLHWTAYSPDAKGDWTTADKNLHDEFMKPDVANAHMAILTNGTRRIYASPEQVTFHAGKSRYDNRDDVNDFSYGIELQNPGNDKGGYAPPLTPSQLESTIEAISKLLDRYNLTLKDVITHKDIRTNYINFYSGKRDKDGKLIIDPEHKAAKSDIDDRMYNTIINGLKARGYK